MADPELTSCLHLTSWEERGRRGEEQGKWRGENTPQTHTTQIVWAQHLGPREESKEQEELNCIIIFHLVIQIQMIILVISSIIIIMELLCIEKILIRDVVNQRVATFVN